MDTVSITPKIKRELTRIIMSRQVVVELNLASRKLPNVQKRQLIALAGRIALCNSPANNWLIKNAYVNTDDSCSDAFDRHWRCGSKLCPSCLARQARLTRTKLRKALAAQPHRGERYHFCTFTIPNPDLPLLETRSIVNYAWSLFRKRSLCSSLIRGGVKSEEFTMTSNGFHYHLHTIFQTQNWIMYNEIRRTWTDCVKTSFLQHGRESLWLESLDRRRRSNAKWNSDNPNGPIKEDLNLIVKCKLIQPTERSIQEVCKYVTKADSWSRMRKSDLVEIALVERWNRMFELFGSFAKRENLPDSGTPLAIVHTESLSDGILPSKTYWRQIVETCDPEVYLYNLETRIDAQIQFGLRNLYYKFSGKPIVSFTEIMPSI